MRILLVEDTPDVGEGIVECLETMGHTVDWAHDGEAGDEHLRASDYQLVVLDLMLPQMSGMAVLKHLRDRRVETPVLIITARSAIDDRIGTLDLGADDYLVKPFDFRELQARVRALLRRHSGDRSIELRCGRLIFDRTLRVARIDGRLVSLTRRELSLLEIFMARQTHVFSKSQLLDQLFGFNSEPSENSIEVMVWRLRRKLVGAGVEITTQRGVGYRISDA